MPKDVRVALARREKKLESVSTSNSISTFDGHHTHKKKNRSGAAPPCSSPTQSTSRASSFPAFFSPVPRQWLHSAAPGIGAVSPLLSRARTAPRRAREKKKKKRDERNIVFFAASAPVRRWVFLSISLSTSTSSPHSLPTSTRIKNTGMASPRDQRQQQQAAARRRATEARTRSPSP